MGRGTACAEGTGATLLYGPGVRRSSRAPEPEHPMVPEMIPVESTSLDSIGFRPYLRDGGIAGDLYVRFRRGDLRRWEGVESEVWAEFLSARSKGSYFSRNIRGNYGASVRLED